MQTLNQALVRAQVQNSLTANIEEIEVNSALLTPEQISKLSRLVGRLGGTQRARTTKVSMDDIIDQYALVLNMRDRVVNSDAQDTLSLRDLATFTNAVSALSTLFLRYQEKIDHILELNNLRDALVKTLKEFPTALSDTFFQTLEGYTNGTQAK